MRKDNPKPVHRGSESELDRLIREMNRLGTARDLGDYQGAAGLDPTVQELFESYVSSTEAVRAGQEPVADEPYKRRRPRLNYREASNGELEIVPPGQDT